VSAASLADRRVRVVIRDLHIAAASAIEARRVADTMPAALEHEFTRLRTNSAGPLSRRERPVDRVASRISEVVTERLRAKP
jgi:hypothetical protein